MRVRFRCAGCRRCSCSRYSRRNPSARSAPVIASSRDAASPWPMKVSNPDPTTFPTYPSIGRSCILREAFFHWIVEGDELVFAYDRLTPVLPFGMHVPIDLHGSIGVRDCLPRAAYATRVAPHGCGRHRRVRACAPRLMPVIAEGPKPVIVNHEAYGQPFCAP